MLNLSSRRLPFVLPQDWPSQWLISAGIFISLDLCSS